MSEFTNGNWERGEMFAFLNIFADGKEVCDCGGDEYTTDNIPIGEREANAHLIAAAPDLLEACEDALSFIEVLTDGHDDSTQDKLRKAIAKAKGESE